MLKSKYVRFCKDPKDGTAPKNELLARSIISRLVALASEAGMIPSNLLSSKINVWMFGSKLPMLSGNLPKSKLWRRSR